MWTTKVYFPPKVPVVEVVVPHVFSLKLVLGGIRRKCCGLLGLGGYPRNFNFRSRFPSCPEADLGANCVKSTFGAESREFSIWGGLTFTQNPYVDSEGSL